MALVPEKLFMVSTSTDTRYTPTASGTGDEMYFTAEQENMTATVKFFDEDGVEREDVELVLTPEMVEKGLVCTRYGALFIPKVTGPDSVYLVAKIRGTEYKTEDKVGIYSMYQLSEVLLKVE